MPRQHDEEIGPQYLHPSLLDSMTQLLAPFVMEKGKTFVLRSIEKVEVTDFELSRYAVGPRHAAASG